MYPRGIILITYGINLDPRHDLNIADFTDSETHPWIRPVLKWDDNVRQIQDFMREAHHLDCKVLAVIAKESYKHKPNGTFAWSHYTAARWYTSRYSGLVDMWQLGNEPDIQSSSSWTMTPQEYIRMLSYWRKYIPTGRIVGPGLASGSNAWWLQIPTYTRALLHATAIHMYQQMPAPDYPHVGWGNGGTVADLLSLFPNQRIWVTEFGAHVPNDFNLDSERAEYISKMKEALSDVDMAAYFCAADSMVQGYGLFDANGNANETYAAYYN